MKNKLKQILSFVLIFTMVFAMVLPGTAVYATDLGELGDGSTDGQTLSLTMTVGDTVTINGYSSKDQYTPSVEGIVEIEQNSSTYDGTVTAVAPGVTTVTRDFYWLPLSQRYDRQSTYTFTVLPNISLKQTAYTIHKGSQYDLTKLVSSYYSGASLSFSSQNTAVATVSGNTVTGQEVGSTVINVSATANGQTKTVQLTLNVDIGVEAADATVYEGQSVAYKAVSYPSGYDITYSVDSSGVISYEGGQLKGLKQGTGVLTAKITVGGKTYSDTANITVASNVKDFTLSPDSLRVYVGADRGFDVTIQYNSENGKKDYPVSYKVSEGNSYVTAKTGTDTQMILRGVQKGTGKVQVTVGGVTKTLAVEVQDVGFDLPQDALMGLYVGGENVTIAPYSTPSGLVPTKVEWTMADPSIASIDANGVVTALKEGETTLYVVVTYNGQTYGDSEYENLKIKCPVKVGSNVRAVEYTDGMPGNGSEINDVVLYEGTTELFRAVVLRRNEVSTIHEITFSSSASDIVSVASSLGTGEATVTARKQGSADITAKSEGKSAVAHVTVISNIKAVKLAETITLNKDASMNVSEGLVEYQDAENGRLLASQQEGGYPITFSSSNLSVFTVTAGGQIQAVGEGTATLSVTLDGKTYYSYITVKETFDKLSFKDSEIQIDLADTSNPAHIYDLIGSEELRVTYKEGGSEFTVPFKTFAEGRDITLNWLSMNIDVVSVSADGIVIAKKVGYATVNVSFGNINANITVKVINGSTEPNFDKSLTYPVVIHYVFGNDCGELAGTSAKDDWYGSYVCGDPVEYPDGSGKLSVTSPSVIGYRPDVAVYEEIIPHITSSIERTVYYHPTTVSFRVKYFRENAEGTYERYYHTGEAEEGVLYNGVTGNSVGLYAYAFDNKSKTEDFKSYTKVSYNRENKIAADGTTTVNIYYNRKKYTVRFSLNGGTGTNPVYGAFGTAIVAADPVREGYTFVGWYSDADLTQAVNLENLTIPEYNVTYFAKWSANSSTAYRIIYWLEDADANTYSVATDSTGKAIVEWKYGTTGTNTAATKRTFTNYDGTGTTPINIAQKAIAGDGSTVVNVYYKRNVYSILFKNGSKTLTDLTITAKWGQNISAKWPSNDVAQNRWAVSNGGSTYQTNIDVMPVGGDTFYVPDSKGSTSYSAPYYVQALTGTSTNIYDKDGLPMVLHHTDTSTGPSSLSVTSEDKYEITGFTFKYVSSSSYSSAKFYYTRNNYSITFHKNYGEGDIGDSVTVPYETDLNQFAGEAYYPDERPGYTFAGWYLDDTCQRKYDFNTTMPDYDIILFAKWEPKKVVLTVISKNIQNESHSVLFEGLSGFHPMNHTKWSEGVLDIWEAPAEDEEFVGWFMDTEDGSAPFSFENEVTQDTVVRARFRTDLTVDVKIHYEGISGAGIETLAADTTDSSFLGDSLTYTAKVIGNGWYPTTNSHTINLDPDPAARKAGETYTEDAANNLYLYEYTFNYTKKSKVGYTVKYLDKETGAPVAVAYTGTTGASVITVNAATVSGYVPTERKKTFILTSNDADNIIIFYYQKNTGDNATVTVDYWLAKPGTDPVEYQETPYRSVSKQVAIGSNFTYTVLQIAGYQFLEATDDQGAAVAATTKVTSSGLYINLYYTCNADCSYTVKYIDYDTDTPVLEEKTVDKQIYGTQVREEAPEIPGYTLVSNSPASLTIDSEPTNNVIVFKYQEKLVNISYSSLTSGCEVSSTAEMGVGGNGLKAKTGTAVGSTAVPAAGYNFVGWYSDSLCKNLVSTELKFVPEKNGPGEVYVSANYYAKFERSDYTYTAHYLLNNTTTPIKSDVTTTATANSYVEPAQILGYEAVTEAQQITSDRQVVTFYYKKKVTLIANSGSFKYDGTEKTVTGFTVNAGDELTGHVADFTGSPASVKASGKATEIGEYDVLFSNGTVGKTDNTGCYVVATVVKGTLEITGNDTPITVTIYGNKSEVTYNGTEQTVTGYDDPEAEGAEGTGFNAATMVEFTETEEVTNPEASGTNAGVYKMGLTADNFICNDEHYTNVSFVVIDGELTIAPKKVTLTSANGTWEYDGEEHTAQTVTPSTDGFISGEGVDITFPKSSAVKHVEAEAVDNVFTYKAKEGTLLSNYDITPVYGELTVTPITDEIIVTINGNTDSKEYDGTEKSVTGFTFTAAAVQDSAKAKAALYEEACIGLASGYTVDDVTASGTAKGDYYMGLTADIFENISADFSNVSFDIGTDGKLTITDKAVVIETLTVGPADAEDRVEGTDFSVTATIETAQDEDVYILVKVDGEEVGFLEIEAGETSGTLSDIPNPNTEDAYLDASDVTFTFEGYSYGSLTSVINDDDKEVKVHVNDTIDTTDVTITSEKEFLTAEEDAKFTVKLSNAAQTNATVNLTVNGQAYPVTIAAGKTSANVTISKPFAGTESALEVAVVSVSGGNFEDVNINDEATVKPFKIIIQQEVIVTITGHTSSVTYNGQIQSVEGYDVVINNKLYSEEDFGLKSGHTAKAQGRLAQLAAYPMGLSESDFENLNEDYDGHVTFVVTDGGLTINKKAVSNMAVTADSDEKLFDGDPLTKNSYQVTPNVIVAGDTLVVEITGSQTAVGSSANVVSSVKVTRVISGETVDVTACYGTFNKVNGTLTVKPNNTEIVIKVKGNKNLNNTYTGTPYSVSDYSVTIPDAYKLLLKKTDFSYSGTTELQETNAGTYYMNLDASKFSNTNTSFTNVKFVIEEDGKLEIKKANVSLMTVGAKNVYSGAPLTNGTLLVSGFVDGEGLKSYEVTGSQLNVGTSENTFTYVLKDNTLADNYNIVETKGTLEVTPVTTEVIVTITGNTKTSAYTGKSQSVEGYTFEANNAIYTESFLTYSGTASDKKATGTYADTYSMNLKKAQFANNSDNFTNVTINVANGWLKITPVHVDGMSITSASDTKVYDGSALTKNSYEVTSGVLVSGDVLEVTITGSQTNAGWSNNTIREYKIMRSGVEVTDCYDTFTCTEGKLTVTPKKVFIKVKDAEKLYGTQDPSFGYDLVDENDKLTTLVSKYDLGTISIKRGDAEGTDPEATGDHVLTADYTPNNNYDVQVKTGTLKITKDTSLTLELTDDTKGKPVAAGQKITYTATVKNTGNLKLTVNVKDSLTGMDKDIVLNPGESYPFSAEYTVTEDDIIKGSVTNTATANAVDLEGDDLDPVVDSINDNTVEADNTLTVTKVGKYPEGKTSLDADDVVTYTITVKNDGNVTVRDIVVEDELLGYTSAKFDLAPGASKTLPESGTLSYTVDEADILNGSIVNKATADGESKKQGGEGATEPAHGEDTATVNTAKAEAALTVTKKSDVKSTAKAELGQVITYTILVKNTGNIAAKDIVVSDALTKLSDTIDLPVDGEKEYVTEYTVTEADIVAGKIDNTVTGKGTGADGKAVEGKATCTVTTEALDNTISVKKTADKTENLKPGDEVTYTFVVKNEGNVTVSSIVVVDEFINYSSEAFSLEPGEDGTKTLKKSYTVQDSDIVAGEIENHVVVTGKDPKNADTSAEDTCTVSTKEVDRSLTLEKKVTNLTVGDKVDVGDVIEYELVITNSGNVTVNDVTVTDAKLGLSKKVGTLLPGESNTTDITGTYRVTEDDVIAGFVKNTAGAAGTSSDGVPTDAAASVIVDTVDVDRTLTVVKNNDVTGTAALGQKIHYTITVKNEGNLKAYDVVVEDELLDYTSAAFDLLPGESKTLPAEGSLEYTVTEDDIMNGSVVNVATAEGKNKDEETTKGEVKKETPTDKAEGKLELVKTSDIPKGNTVVLDQTINYTFTVTNTGNITVTGIIVKDEKADYETPDNEKFDLAPGESKSLYASYKVKQEDILAGAVKNEATVSGTDKKGNEPEGKATNEIPTSDISRNLTVTKTSDVAENEKALLGQVINYEIVVKNEGNLTANNIKVDDPLTGFTTTIASLAPGASSEAFKTSYKVTEKDVETGYVLNTVTAKGKTTDDKDTTGGEGENTVPTEAKKYVLSLAKTSDVKEGEKAGLNQKIYYTLVVTNDSNQTITNITVSDPLTNLTTVIASLAPKASSDPIQVEYVVTEADIKAGKITNKATAKGYGPNGTETEGGEAELTLLTEEKDRTIKVTKTSDFTEGKAELGQKITYHILVENTGNLTATGVVLTDEKLNYTSDPRTMKPGDSFTVDLEYTVTEDDILNGSVVNVATAGGTSSDGEPTEGGEDTHEVPTEEPDRTLTTTKIADTEGPVDAKDVITYTIKVKNDGNLTAYNVVVTDEKTKDEWTITSLAPGATWEKQTSPYTVTEADLLVGKVVNTVTAKGKDKEDTPTEGGEVTNEVPTKEVEGTLTMEKYSDKTEGQTVGLNEVVTYYLKVTNNTNATVRNIVISDEMLGFETEEPFSLQAGEYYIEELTYTVDINDLKAGSVTNSASVSGELSGGSELEDSDEYTLPTSAIDRNLTVEKKATNVATGEKVKLGQEINYSITVKNTGNMAAKDITIEDTKVNLRRTNIELAAGESITVTADPYTVTEADIIKGYVYNVATAKGTTEDGEPTTGGEGENEVPTVDKDYTITVTKDSDVPEGEKVALKDIITYTITVKNDGNLTAEDVTITDEKIDFTETVKSLEPGAYRIYQKTYEVTEDDILAGMVHNEVTVTGTSVDDTPIEGGDENDVPTEDKDKTLTVVKEASKSEGVVEGETVTYTITVTNSGNLTAENITVVDELTELEETIDTLAPGDSKEFKTTYIVTKEDVETGYVRNVATAKGTTEDGDTDGGEGEKTIYPVDKSRQLTVTKVNDVPSGELADVGRVINYTITVENNSGFDAKNVEVTDDLTGESWSIVSLPIGAKETFTTTLTVLESHLKYGKLENHATAVGTDTDDIGKLSGEASSEVQLVVKNPHISMTKVSDIPAGQTAKLGQVVTYTITVVNDGNQVLKDVNVVDKLTGMDETIAVFNPGTTEIFYTEYTVTEEDILRGYIHNSATAKGKDEDEEEGGDEDEEDTPTEEKKSELTLVKDANKSEGVVEGETVTYTITVTNSGNLTAENISVVDELTGLEETIDTLAPGESKEFKTTYTVTKEDVERGYVQNVATSKGTTEDGDTEGGEGEKKINTIEKSRQLTVTKTNDVPSGEKAGAGRVITYTITVENNSGFDAKNVEVTDDLTGESWSIASLPIGAKETFTTTLTVLESYLKYGTLENHATAVGTDTDDIGKLSGENFSEVVLEEKNSHITLTKSSNVPAGQIVGVGDTITYTITVVNDGNQTLNNVRVLDNLTGLDETITTFVPGAKETYYTEYVVTKEDVDRGYVHNSATAKGTDEDEEENGGGEDEENTPTEEKKSELTLVKNSSVAAGSTASLGQVITYTITVTNTGDLTAYNVAVNDQMTGLSTTIPALEPGASQSFNTTYTVKQSDILRGYIYNTATAKGTDEYGGETGGGEGGNNTPTDGKSSHLTVTKTSDVGRGEKVTAGRVITYTIRVKNDGNLTISNITVEDKLTGLKKTGLSLTPGQEAVYTTTYTVTDADVAAGKVVNRATAKGTDPEGKENGGGEGGNEIQTGEGSAYLKVVKTSNKLAGEKAELGEEITYTIKVTNTGNLTAQNISVIDEKTGMKENIASLAPGATKTFNTKYKVTEEDIVNGRVLNFVTAKGTDTNGDLTDGGDGQDEVLTEDLDNTIKMEKTANVKAGKTVEVGETIAYTLKVSNKGNVSVKHIKVVDGLTDFEEVINVLKPGETKTFTTEYTVTEEDASAGRVLNMAKAEGTAPDGKKTEDKDSETHVTGEDEVEVEVTEEETTEEPTTEEPTTEEPTTEDDPTKQYDPNAEDLNADGTPKARGNGYWALVNLILTVFTALVSLLLILVMRNRQRRAEDEALMSEDTRWFDENEELEKNRKLWRYFTVFISSAAIVIFILTEDVTQTMRMTDKYTVLMAIIALVQLLAAVLAKKKRDDRYEAQQDDEEVMA